MTRHATSTRTTSAMICLDRDGQGIFFYALLYSQQYDHLLCKRGYTLCKDEAEDCSGK
jgi:hypothetical protein